jgi:hypothetical protein
MKQAENHHTSSRQHVVAPGRLVKLVALRDLLY